MANGDTSGTDDKLQALFGEFVPGQQDSTANPMMRAKEMMKAPLPKRFYKTVTIGDCADADGEQGFRILLDGRPIRSPAKKVVTAPNRLVAEALASEWDAQAVSIDPAQMPLTRLVNSAIDGVEAARGAILDECIAYLNHDFLCYPASHPVRLVERQKALWQPVLDWAGDALGGRFVQASGILAVEQSPVMGEALRAHWSGLDVYQMAALHTIMTLTGSTLLAFAFWRGSLDREGVWEAAMVDEHWNIELWGEDEEASKRIRFRRADFDAAALVIESSRDGA